MWEKRMRESDGVVVERPKSGRQRCEVTGTQTLERGLGLLREIAAAGEAGADLQRLCASSGCSKTTTYRLLQALRRQGFVGNGRQRGRFVLGYELFALAAQAGNAHGLRDLARPALWRLARRFGDSFFLLVPDGHHVLCLEMQDGEQPVRCYSHAVGGRIPMGVGQGSQVLLAQLGRTERNAILEHNAALLRIDYGLDPKVIAGTLDSVRRLGFACGVPDRRLPGYTGLAVPIVDAGGQLLGALSCALSRPRMTQQRRLALAAAMAEEVRRMLEKAQGLLRLEVLP
ncbi:MAG TPA: IclR family transcriptional regulator [Pseudomonas sp.]|nr:IclR family transcriptional regulator [Pseudomonas sp.]